MTDREALIAQVKELARKANRGCSEEIVEGILDIADELAALAPEPDLRARLDAIPKFLFTGATLIEHQGSTLLPSWIRWVDVEAVLNSAIGEAPEPDLRAWQPIATASKDGTTVLGRTPYANVLCGDVYYNPELEQWERLPSEHVRPTHWMPLPSPPTGEPT